MRVESDRRAARQRVGAAYLRLAKATAARDRLFTRDLDFAERIVAAYHNLGSSDTEVFYLEWEGDGDDHRPVEFHHRGSTHTTDANRPGRMVLWGPRPVEFLESLHADAVAEVRAATAELEAAHAAQLRCRVSSRRDGVDR